MRQALVPCTPLPLPRVGARVLSHSPGLSDSFWHLSFLETIFSHSLRAVFNREVPDGTESPAAWYSRTVFYAEWNNVCADERTLLMPWESGNGPVASTAAPAQSVRVTGCLGALCEVCLRLYLSTAARGVSALSSLPLEILGDRPPSLEGSSESLPSTPL